MADEYKGRLAGHTLVGEGRLPGRRKGAGTRYCTCGWNMFCASDNDAKREHRKHKGDKIEDFVANGVDDRGREVHL